MKIKSFKIVCKLYPNTDDYDWEYDYVPQKDEEVEIKGIRYVVADKTFYYDDSVLRMTLMRLGR